MIEGRQGIEQERYLTITIERKDFEEARHSLPHLRQQYTRYLYQ